MPEQAPTDPTDPTDPGATHDAPQDPPQGQGPAMDDTQAEATGGLADQLPPVSDDDLED